MSQCRQIVGGHVLAAFGSDPGTVALRTPATVPTSVGDRILLRFDLMKKGEVHALAVNIGHRNFSSLASSFSTCFCSAFQSPSARFCPMLKILA